MANSNLFFFLVIAVASVSAYTLEKSFFSPKDENSCVGRCGNRNTTLPCQCNTACQSYGDCCADYLEVCMSSCVGRCGNRNTTLPCQCNTACQSYGDCCPDYSQACGVVTTSSTPRPGPITDPELSELSEELYLMDVNNVARCISVNMQGRTTSGSTADLAPLPLLTMQNCAYTGPTISRLMALHDNYAAEVGTPENDTPIDLEEREAFLDAIFATPVMQRTQEFLASKGLPNGRDVFTQIWFEHYRRGSSGNLGSSGFEHIFLGELNSGVSGFHNWVYFAREENNANLNYRGWMDNIDLGSKGSIIEHTFAWRNQNKPITSMFIGTSPELELSLYTVCYYARANAKCPLTFGGELFRIQTYNINQNGKTYVASAYPDLSD